MARWNGRALDRAIAGGLILGVGFAMRPQAHFLTRRAAQALAVVAAARLFTRSARRRTQDATVPGTVANSTLVSIVAHEIRAPLTAIRGAAALLDEYEMQLDRARRQELLQVALDASNQLARLVDDLLLVSRIVGGRLAVERMEVDIASIVREAARAEVTREVVYVEQNDLPNVIADPVRVRQIVTNLLSNALAHATEGSVVIAAITHAQGHVRVAIYNDGAGIAPEEQSKLFLPFAALNPRRVDSTGLGLFIAKELAEVMGGSIGFTTQPGRNAVFWFTLPAAPPVRAKSNVPSAPLRV